MRASRQSSSSVSVAEQSPGLKDPVVLAWAVRDHLLLLTADRDSGDMIMRDLSRVPPQGVVLVRLKHTPPDLKALMVVDAFIRHGTRFRDAFSVVTRGRVRRRPLP